MYWVPNTFLVITGASRGIGKQIAIDFGRKLGPNSTVLLTARSLGGLNATKEEILRERPDINVNVEACDLSFPDFTKYLGILSQATRNEDFQSYIIVHNAGSIVVDTPTSEMNDLSQWNKYMTVNMYSASILTSAFLKICGIKKCCVVNISSLCGKIPFNGLGMYCVAKAGREMYFKVLASEHPEIEVLNYSPGPIDTDMYQEVANNCCFSQVKHEFAEMKECNKVVKVEDTVSRLINLLEQGDFQSGDTIDYYGR